MTRRSRLDLLFVRAPRQRWKTGDFVWISAENSITSSTRCPQKCLARYPPVPHFSALSGLLGVGDLVLLGLTLAAPRGDESELGAWDTSTQQDRHSDHGCNGMSLPVQTAAWKRSRQTGQRWSRGGLSAAPASQSDPSNRCLGKDRARAGLWITFCEGQAHKLSLLRGSWSRGCVCRD